MKLKILAIFAIILSGCQHAPEVIRTGTICVEPTVYTEFKTNDYVDVRPDVAERIAADVTKEIKKRMETGSALKLTACPLSDYQLFSSVSKIYTETKDFVNPWTGRRSRLREYNVSVEWSLKNKDKKAIITSSNDKDEVNISDIVSDISENIVKDIRTIDPAESAKQR
jgi:hypothetical protein